MRKYPFLAETHIALIASSLEIESDLCVFWNR
jgi:hypothetical protein